MIDLTLSACDFPEEFTCNSGSCIDIFQHCNNKKDCDDGSDEENCTVLKIPSTYDSSIPPEYGHDKNQPNEIYTQVKVINIDEVNTITMTVGLTIDIFFKWRDHRINYSSLRSYKDEKNAVKIVPNEEKPNVWTPLPELVHDNAIIGQIKEVDFYHLEIDVENGALPVDPKYPRETLIYSGANNTLVVSKRMKLKFRCNFFLLFFPFDGTTCDFYHSIRTIGNSSLKLINDEYSVIYEGPRTLNEFKIVNFWSGTSQSQAYTSFIYTFEFSRLYEQHLMTTFFQSFLLWILAFITLFIDEDDFSNRFMGAVTALLVLVALLASLGEHLPKVAYFKYIDLWFNWFVANIFLIIFVHVIIDYHKRRQEHEKEKKRIGETSSKLFTNSNDSHQNKDEHIIRINNVCKVLLLITTGIFICIYFIINKKQN